MRFFKPMPGTQEELKKMYRKLAMKHHPDSGGDTETMKKVNAEYEELFKRVGHVHMNAKGEKYEKATTETPEHFINIINILIRFEGVVTEIIGTFIWCSGNTKPYKETFKELGFRWSSNKTSWYLAPEGYKRRSGKNYSLQDIRDMYVSQEVENKPFSKVAASA